MVQFFASYRDAVAAGKLTLGALADLYAETRGDRRELVEAWVMLDRVFAAPKPQNEGGGD